MTVEPYRLHATVTLEYHRFSDDEPNVITVNFVDAAVTATQMEAQLIALRAVSGLLKILHRPVSDGR